LEGLRPSKKSFFLALAERRLCESQKKISARAAKPPRITKRIDERKQKMKRVLVIGGGAAGTGAATMAIQTDRSLDVTLVGEF